MKISYNDVAYILNFQKKHWFKKFSLNYFLSEINDSAMRLTTKVKLPIILITFVPASIIMFLHCLWSGG